jgi:hypothetical protein
MATLLEYFNNDFRDANLDTPINCSVTTIDEQTGERVVSTIEIHLKTSIGFVNSCKLVSFYIPFSEGTAGICESLISNAEIYFKNTNGILIKGGYTGDVTLGEVADFYSNRVYIYSEKLISKDELSQLEPIVKSKGLHVTFRSSDYVNKVAEMQKPLAFISHDTRDKDLIARALAEGLSSRSCPVWYDEYSLKVGDHLRESIEKGIKEAKKCILVITPSFLSNPGWTKVEFNSIFTRELLFNESIILPIWYKVNKLNVYEYSPNLSDTYALNWPDPTSMTELDYRKSVQELISKIHLGILKKDTNGA